MKHATKLKNMLPKPIKIVSKPYILHNFANERNWITD